MKSKLFVSLALLSVSFASALPARACGGVTAPSRMCVAIPEAMSTFLQSEEALELVAGQGHIRHLAALEGSVQIATSKKTEVTGEVVGRSVSSVRLVRYRWPIDAGWFVLIEEYPGLVKLLTSLQYRGLTARLRVEGARITSLYAMADGSGLIRINGTAPGAYSVVGILSPTGELSGLEIRE